MREIKELDLYGGAYLSVRNEVNNNIHYHLRISIAKGTNYKIDPQIWDRIRIPIYKEVDDERRRL